jgi:hypothetical protein
MRISFTGESSSDDNSNGRCLSTGIFKRRRKGYNQRMERIRPGSAQEATPTASRWGAFLSKTLPVRYPFFVLLILVAVGFGQLIEDALDTPTLEMLTPNVSIPRWTLVLLTLYMLVMLRLIQRTAMHAMRDVRPAVQCDDLTFQDFRQRLSRVHIRTDIVLTLLSVAFVVLLFRIFNTALPVTRNPLTNERTYLPTDPWNALIVIVAYSLVGWAALSLLVNTVRLGKALGDLTRLPLALNAYDTDNVLPFGRLALVLSLAPAGIVLILLVGLGSPTRLLAWFAVLLASLASVLALILPLRGVHRQMEQSKKHALEEINHDLSAIHDEVVHSNVPESESNAQLSNRTNILVNLRKVVQEGQTWPFRDTLAVTRALLVASAPIIYTALNELIRRLILEPLVK